MCAGFFYVDMDQSLSKKTTEISLNVQSFFNQTIHRIHEYRDLILSYLTLFQCWLIMIYKPTPH